MYPNLDAEMARRKITRQTLAKELRITPSTLSFKLNGKTVLTLAECIEIRNVIDPKLSIDYLFASNDDN